MIGVARHTDRHDDTGIEIMPGVVVVDLAIADVSTLSPSMLRAAFNEAEVQAAEEAMDVEDVLGDLDLNPL